MTKLFHGLSKFDIFAEENLRGHALNDSIPLPQVFGYLLDENPITGNLGNAKILQAFDELVDTMKRTSADDGPADAGMTFFGQFVDHDVTLDATSSIGRKIDPRSIRNIRTPNLDLDCVYGDGPDASPHLYGQGEFNEFMLMGTADNLWDLPRNSHGRALIGDPRNDENVIVSQIQGAFITLHNILVGKIKNEDAARSDVCSCAQMNVRSAVWEDIVPKKLHDFESVRRFIRLHYQWLVLHHLLPAFVTQDCIDRALEWDLFGEDAPIMPAEFSGAAYRFGHATVQQTYALSEGKPTVKLFDMLGFSPRNGDWDLEMGRFFAADEAAQMARPVGTGMAETLFTLPDNIVGGGFNWGTTPVSKAQAKKLALRNILRDRATLLLPSGQQVVRWLNKNWQLDIPELAAPEALARHHISKTPLWFYCLQEAETLGGGRLTGAGGHIVASVIVRLLQLDPESLLHTPDFEPWSGFGAPFTMGGLMKYVEQHRDSVPGRDKLVCG